MKKATNKVIALGIFVIALLFLAAPQRAFASVDVDGLSYDVWVSETGENIAVLVACGLEGDVTVPETIAVTIDDWTEIYTVTGIGYNAFGGVTSLTSVKIPESVTYIGDSAFGGCSSLTSVTIPNSVTSIGGGVFYGCSSLLDVTIPASVTYIDNYTFYGCSSLTDVTIPASVTYIGVSAFEGCSSLPDVTIPGNVTTLQWGAFRYCTSLTSISIPSSVTGMYSAVFEGCISLASVSIPNSVTSIDDAAFRDCSSLTSVTIPDSLIGIGDWAFYGCSSLTSVSIPNSVTYIITSVTIPESVIYIGDNAFSGCTRLTDAQFWGYAPSISMGAEVFEGCDPNFKIYYFSKDQAFTNPWGGYPTELYGIDVIDVTGVSVDPTAVTIQTGDTTSIAATVSPADATNNKVAWSTSDETVATVDPSGMVTAVGAGTATITATTEDGGFAAICTLNVIAETADGFEYTASKTDWGDDVATIIGYNDRGLGWDITIPETINDGVKTYTVTSIGNNAFIYSNVTSVTIPDSVTSIGEWAFYLCESLESVMIPNSITSIGPWTFYSCSNLTSVTIPASVISIGDNAFYNCISLTSVTIPDSVTIPASLTSIGEYAFTGCISLTSVTIPGSVTTIGNGAFFYCTSLMSVTISNGVTSIGDGMFNSCNNLTSVAIPDSVISIGYGAFIDCSSLTSVTIPASVTSIGDFAFLGSGLMDAKFLGSAPSINMGPDVFYDCHPNFKIYYFSENQGFTNPWYGYPTELYRIGATGVTVDPTTVTIQQGDTTSITATVSPTDATNNKVIWSTSGEDVATVDPSGMVTAAGVGTATITATTEDGNFTAACEVTVEGPVTGIDPISGTAQVGQTLTAGALTPSGATATYQWQSSSDSTNFADINGATLSTYVPVAADVGTLIRVAATGTGGYTGTVYSAATTAVTVAPITGIGSISGTAQVGETLTVGELTPSETTATYQWQIGNSLNGKYKNIDGATSSTYVPVAGDAGKFIRVVATGTGGYSGTVTSAPTSAVTVIPVTGVEISGTAQVGQTLTASVSPSGATVKYQWQSSSTLNGKYKNISRATSSTYVPVAGDAGKFIRVVVTATGSYTGTFTSASVGAIVPEP